MRVKMYPHPARFADEVSGIHTVVKAYFKHLPRHGITLVDPGDENYDVAAVHAGSGRPVTRTFPFVAILHGLHWTADYVGKAWEWHVNRDVIENVRLASQITVPSSWVAETIQRDLRVSPTILPHGIDWEEWQHNEDNKGYVIGYAKNRAFSDVCHPTFLAELARRFPNTTFLSTFDLPSRPLNVIVTGLMPPEKMKLLIQRSACVISPIKETFGILTLEAMAAGKPVLGYAYGGNLDLIKHGVTGYLAKPGSYDELEQGLNYCLQFGKTLGDNGRQVAKEYTWDKACQILTDTIGRAKQGTKPSVAVVIPSYNYSHVVGRAIDSVLEQTVPVNEIVVVDDGSQDEGATAKVVAEYTSRDKRVRYIRTDNQGVACARNTGIDSTTSKYIICLDADDQIDTQFVQACKGEMDKDNSLGIAYTGLMVLHPDGRKQQSEWPPKFDYERMLKPGGNCVPTACMFRREAWRRLGGYRQRYAPQGAGSEDAEFWLRMGAYGWYAKKATDAALFIYSIGQGNVSGNPQYHEVDWHALHPWSSNGEHPFASIARPAADRPSHAVRQYDEPVVSVIIPVGSGHRSQVFNALDSLESQTFRQWEVVVVDDSGETGGWAFDGVPDMLPSYPYVRLVRTAGKMGAGHARNVGATLARAPLLLFLDADDNLLSSDALRRMVDVWNTEGAIVYTDYVHKAYIDKEEAERLKKAGRLIYRDDKSGLCMVKAHAEDYDCSRAVTQPEQPFYIWNLITSLLPKAWHDEVGGFDENMPSWEDWLYWLRMARAGKCFVRVAEPLVAYRFYTGGRRETGIQMHKDLIQYITNQLKEVPTMGCKCGGKTIVNNPPQPQRGNAASIRRGQTTFDPNNINDDDMLLCYYSNPNRGQHPVYGPTTKIFYGYRAGGNTEEFYVHKLDIRAHADWFIPKPINRPNMESIEAVQTSTPPPSPISQQFILQKIPGVSQEIADLLVEQYGITTPEELLEFGTDGLAAIPSIAPTRAKNIIKGVQKLLGNKDDGQPAKS